MKIGHQKDRYNKEFALFFYNVFISHYYIFKLNLTSNLYFPSIALYSFIWVSAIKYEKLLTLHWSFFRLCNFFRLLLCIYFTINVATSPFFGELAYVNSFFPIILSNYIDSFFPSVFMFYFLLNSGSFIDDSTLFTSLLLFLRSFL